MATTTPPAPAGKPATYLPLNKILTGPKKRRIPVNEFATFLPDHGNVHLFIGHITKAEAQRRINAHETLHGGIRVSRTKVLKRVWTINEEPDAYWVLFQRHEAGCDWISLMNDPDNCLCGDPDDCVCGDLDDLDEFEDCECAEDADWYPNPVPAGTPGAVAVSTASAFDDQDDDEDGAWDDEDDEDGEW